MLIGTGQSIFEECWKEACDKSISSADPTGKRFTEESYTIVVEKFKAKTFKKIASRTQIVYMHNNLHKAPPVSIRPYSTRLTEMKNYLRLFLGLDSNMPLEDSVMINIIIFMVPTK